MNQATSYMASLVASHTCAFRIFRGWTPNAIHCF